MILNPSKPPDVTGAIPDKRNDGRRVYLFGLETIVAERDHIGLALTRNFEDQFILVPFNIELKRWIDGIPVRAG